MGEDSSRGRRHLSMLSVLKGEAGNSSLLYNVACGLLPQAYRTTAGLLIPAAETTIEFPSIFALAQTNFLSAAAIAKPFNSPPFAIKPPPVFLKYTRILLPSICILSYNGPE